MTPPLMVAGVALVTLGFMSAIRYAQHGDKWWFMALLVGILLFVTGFHVGWEGGLADSAAFFRASCGAKP